MTRKLNKTVTHTFNSCEIKLYIPKANKKLIFCTFCFASIIWNSVRDSDYFWRMTISANICFRPEICMCHMTILIMSYSKIMCQWRGKCSLGRMLLQLYVYLYLQARTLVVINVSPLEYGHVLLIPDVDACRPQVG